VASASAVEEHLAARTKPRHEVLEVRHRRRSSSEHSGVERTAASREKPKSDQAAADLEAPIGDVFVRDPVAGEVERWPEQERERT
jgi:hypothetical protein